MEVSTRPRGRFLTSVAPQHVRAEAMAVVRDEMRAPLLGLEALLDALGGAPLSREVSERMQSQSRVLARRVSLLIEDLALVSRQDLSAIPMDVEVLDLDAELAACAESFPDVFFRVDGDTGLQVRADRLRVQQICANLMRNSQRQGGRPVTIKVSGRAGFVSLVVSNAGPPDSHELGIVRMLVEAHGGRASHDVPGSLTLTLPRAGSLSVLPVGAR